MNTTATGAQGNAVYRWRLWRCWDEALPTVVFVMLNPSTADVEVNDPTVRRCLGFARAWGYGRLEVRNLFDLRTTDPRAMLKHGAPKSEWCDDALRHAVVDRDVVAAWGNDGAHLGRGMWVARKMLRPNAAHLWHLGLTKTGHPKHPLYLRNDVARTEWLP
jgi:hypothetical protein